VASIHVCTASFNTKVISSIWFLKQCHCYRITRYVMVAQHVLYEYKINLQIYFTSNLKRKYTLYRHWGSVQAVRSLSWPTALEGGEETASCPGRSLPPGKTRYPLYRRLGGPQGRSGQVRKISPPTGIQSPDRPVRSQSLYRLSYPSPHIKFGYEKCKCSALLGFKYVGCLLEYLWQLKEVLRRLGWLHTAGIWLYCDCFMWVYLVLCLF